ncbi:hypothetical protein [Rhizobium laguerreae]|uniref:hypothetical protein n=1 Tax=Rhizobium laguerreae TaxID=1076926 RepID=UPI001C90A5CD|nr:hypothetical protein [Rhizobium laguerreae]MBY3447428.1 hypothetical protein [Rhizobium laguerreae]
MKWWWACTPEHDDADDALKAGDSNRKIRLSHPQMWDRCVDFFAPTAKLIMNGRRIRTMLGPELHFAEQMLSVRHGITVEIFPSFEYPDEELLPEAFYFYSGANTLKCDVSSVSLQRPSGKILTPWLLRRWPLLAQKIIENMGGTEFAYFSVLRDWSPWLVSDAVYRDLQPFMRQPRIGELVYDFAAIHRPVKDASIFARIKRFVLRFFYERS